MLTTFYKQNATRVYRATCTNVKKGTINFCAVAEFYLETIAATDLNFSYHPATFTRNSALHLLRVWAWQGHVQISNFIPHFGQSLFELDRRLAITFNVGSVK